MRLHGLCAAGYASSVIVSVNAGYLMAAIHNQIPRSKLRGIKLASQQSCRGFDLRGIRQIDMQACRLGSLLAEIKEKKGITDSMKLISWNVNGLRACLQKGFLDFFKEADADIFCLQETKLSAGQLDLDLEGYHQYWNYAEKKGYSGTAIFTRQEPIKVTYGIGVEEHDHEGRVICAEYPDFYVVTVYVPNSQRELTRLAYRMEWEEAFLGYLKKLEEKKPVVFCGDLNVAHKEIDLKNPKTNRGNAGFTDEERNCFSRVVENGFIDTFRYFYPELADAYSWWSYMGQARAKNIGWRIDYFVTSKALEKRLKDAKIHSHVLGSDHCPVELDME